MGATENVHCVGPACKQQTNPAVAQARAERESESLERFEGRLAGMRSLADFHTLLFATVRRQSGEISESHSGRAVSGFRLLPAAEVTPTLSEPLPPQHKCYSVARQHEIGLPSEMSEVALKSY